MHPGLCGGDIFRVSRSTYQEAKHVVSLSSSVLCSSSSCFGPRPIVGLNSLAILRDVIASQGNLANDEAFMKISVHGR